MCNVLVQAEFAWVSWISHGSTCRLWSSLPSRQVGPQNFQNKDQDGMHDGLRIVILNEADQGPWECLGFVRIPHQMLHVVNHWPHAILKSQNAAKDSRISTSHSGAWCQTCFQTQGPTAPAQCTALVLWDLQILGFTKPVTGAAKILYLSFRPKGATIQNQCI